MMLCKECEHFRQPNEDSYGYCDKDLQCPYAEDWEEVYYKLVNWPNMPRRSAPVCKTANEKIISCIEGAFNGISSDEFEFEVPFLTKFHKNQGGEYVLEIWVKAKEVQGGSK